MTSKKNESEDIFPGVTPSALEAETKNNMKSFDKLVDSLSSAHDKKKSLWKQVYENAVTDRRNAYIMFTDLYTKVHGINSEHAVHGQTLSKYMERLSKSNEQLIKLAEIIDDAVAEDEEENDVTESDIFDELEGNDVD